MSKVQGYNKVRVNTQEIYVYGFSASGLTFKKCRSIPEAIRLAINIPGSYILCNGQEVHFNVLGNNKAAYMISNGKVKLCDIVKY